MTDYSAAEREAAAELLWPHSGTAKFRPDEKHKWIAYVLTAGNIWGRAVDLQCELTRTQAQRDGLIEALESIAENLNPDDKEGYRSDNPEGAMDTSYAQARSALDRCGK